MESMHVRTTLTLGHRRIVERAARSLRGACPIDGPPCEKWSLSSAYERDHQVVARLSKFTIYEMQLAGSGLRTCMIEGTKAGAPE
eukprot:46103-Eustigmatos_ZCMA.PRE.1